MMIVKASSDSEAGKMPSVELMAAMGKYNEELLKAGILRDFGGLKPTSGAARVVFSGGKRTVIDGPFAETKELIGGYWAIEVGSKEEALQWALKAPCPHESGDAQIEIRQFFEFEDFQPSEAVDGMRGMVERLAARK
jgi:hypothetical protein